MAARPTCTDSTDPACRALWTRYQTDIVAMREEAARRDEIVIGGDRFASVAGGIKADTSTINAQAKTLSEATGNPPVTSTNASASDQGFFSAITGPINDIIEDPSSIVGGVATYAGGFVNGAGETIADTYNDITNTVGGLFGEDENDIIATDPSISDVPSDLASIGTVDPLSITDSRTALSGTQTVDTPQIDPDWRVKLTLPEGSTHLYKSPNPGILSPLSKTGLIFPYTPTISIQHIAEYSNYDLTHSNYRGYFYKGSSVQNIIVSAVFTAQDTFEANYMLAALHFLKSCTKMFYGQDFERGTPPQIVMLSGLGEYQFKNHPCAVTLMNYNLPNDVDYIAAGVPDDIDPSANFQQSNPSYSGHRSWSASIGRLTGAGLTTTGQQRVTNPVSAQINNNNGDIDGITSVYHGKTYVPTKIEINFTMIPIQTRKQVSTQFSLKEYANGSLLKEGFW